MFKKQCGAVFNHVCVELQGIRLVQDTGIMLALLSSCHATAAHQLMTKLRKDLANILKASR